MIAFRATCPSCSMINRSFPVVTLVAFPPNLHIASSSDIVRRQISILGWMPLFSKFRVCFCQTTRARARLENISDLDVLVGRELELWKGIVALATFFDRKKVSISKFTSSPSSLTTLILELAVQDAKQRQTENTTETGSVILAQVLLNIVKAKEYKDDFLPVKALKEKMAEAYDEEQKWLTTKWIGNALRRLGFTEKRRVGTGYQYKICKAEVEDLAERLNIEEAWLSPTFGDLERNLRETWQKGTKEQFFELVQKNSDYNTNQAREWIEKLIEEGKMSFDPDGWLVWV